MRKEVTLKAKLNIILFGILIGIISRSEQYRIEKKQTKNPITKLFNTTVIITVYIKYIMIIWFICHLINQLINNSI